MGKNEIIFKFWAEGEKKGKGIYFYRLFGKSLNLMNG
jgi:hypothetical protein